MIIKNKDNTGVHGYRFIEYKRWCGIAFLLSASVTLALVTPKPTQAQTYAEKTFNGVYPVCQITGDHIENGYFGPQVHNQDENVLAKVYGTDLGASYLGADLQQRFLFGDTYGKDNPSTGNRNDSRRSNVIANSPDFWAEDCLDLTYIKDGNNTAKNIFPYSWWLGSYPTSGLTDWYVYPGSGLEFVIVSRIIVPPTWESWSTEVWFTADGWQNKSQSAFNFMALNYGENFEIVYAMDNYTEEYYYFYGAKLMKIRQSFNGGIQIMRIKKVDLYNVLWYRTLVPEIYAKCGTEKDWKSVNNMGSCTPIDIIKPATEGSVMWHPAFNKYLGLGLEPTLDPNDPEKDHHHIIMGWSKRPEGPWDEYGKATVIDCNTCGPHYECYAPILVPWHTWVNGGTDVYFVSSRMSPFGSAALNGCSSYYCDRATGEEQSTPLECNQIYNVFLHRLQLKVPK